MNFEKTPQLTAAIMLVVSLLLVQPVSATPVDWSSIQTRMITLFYPGQSSYQWLRDKKHGNSYREVERGDSCVSCHMEEEHEIGEMLVSGEYLEPSPISGKPGTLDLLVQATYDADNAYLRFRWKTGESEPGVAHTNWRFDGKNWQSYGESRLDWKVRNGDVPAIQEDRLSLMIDDWSVPMFAAQGCWLTCHDGMTDMPKEPNQLAIDGDVLLGDQLHATEVKKYLPGSRADHDATWSEGKSVEELNGLKESGGFVDLLQWSGNRSNSVNMADDGYVLEYRHTDDGQSIFSPNWDEAKNQPLYMFDQTKTGFKAKTATDLRDVSHAYALVPESNAIRFDPRADWKKGDVLPMYVVSRANASGSAADNQDVQAEWKDGEWTVVWTRKLNTGNPDDKVMRPGTAVVVGFAIHDDNTSSRSHYVSFPVTLGFGVGRGVDIDAVPMGDPEDFARQNIVGAD